MKITKINIFQMKMTNKRERKEKEKKWRKPMVFCRVEYTLAHGIRNVIPMDNTQILYETTVSHTLAHSYPSFP